MLWFANPFQPPFNWIKHKDETDKLWFGWKRYPQPEFESELSNISNEGGAVSFLHPALTHSHAAFPGITAASTRLSAPHYSHRSHVHFDQASQSEPMTGPLAGWRPRTELQVMNEENNERYNGSVSAVRWVCTVSRRALSSRWLTVQIKHSWSFVFLPHAVTCRPVCRGRPGPSSRPRLEPSQRPRETSVSLTPCSSHQIHYSMPND